MQKRSGRLERKSQELTTYYGTAFSNLLGSARLETTLSNFLGVSMRPSISCRLLRNAVVSSMDSRSPNRKSTRNIFKKKEENRPTPRAVGICDRRWYFFAQRYRRHAAGELKTPQNLLTYAKLCSKDLTKSAQWKNFDKWVDVMPKQYAGKSERAVSFFFFLSLLLSFLQRCHA